MSGYIDQLFRAFDETKAVEDLESAEAAARSAQAEVESCRQTLEAYRAWQALRGHGSRETPASLPPQEASTDISASLTPAQSVTGREAIRRVFASKPAGAELSIPEVSEALGVGRGERDRLSVTLQRLVNRGELVRPRKGIYRLPLPTDGTGLQ